MQVENEDRAELPIKPAGSDEDVSPLENSVRAISGKLNSISRTQKYFRTRENRNFATVKSTEGRIFWFSTVESIAIIAMAVCQVAIVQYFFTGCK